MSTAPGSEATFIQGNQSLAEQDASHSALFYLFQEVSRLASSPVNKSFLDTNSPSKWLNETSRRDHFIIKQEEDSAHLSQTLSGSCQQSLSGMLPYDQMSKMTEESHSDKVATLPHCECNSPWKVLSLINLQCERLLHRGDVEGSDPSSVSLTVKSDHPAAKLLSPPGDVTELGYRCDTINVKDTLKPLLTEGQGVIAVSHAEDVSRVVSNNKPQCCVKDSKEDFSVQRQTEEKTDCVIPELVEENATESYQLQHKDQREVMFSVNRQLEWIQECKKHCLSPEQDILNVRVSENALLQVESHNASLNTQLPFKSNEDTSVALSKSDLTLDYNANIALDLKLPCDTQLLPLSTAVFFNATESCFSVPKSDHAVTDSGCMFASKEERSTSFEQLKSVMLNADLKRPLQKEEIAPASSHQWRTKTPRKQPRPSRSVDVQDPDFQGVTFSMGTELDDNREQCRLLITSKYSKELFKSTRKSKLRTRTSQKSVTTSNSDDESDPMSTVSKDKVCASCCTRKTPMWRDAEDGTPLCNACGIRYKKYRVRCVNCWHIPRKEGNSNSSCLKCGNSVKLTSAQRKHTT